MVNQEYRLAFSETLDILNHTNNEDVKKIPKKFIQFLNDNALDKYDSKIDYSKNLKEMNLNPRTIGILSIINQKYWCNEEERKSFNKKLKENEEKYRESLKNNKNISKSIPKEEIQKENKNNIKPKNNNKTSIVKYQKMNWYQKFFERIIKLFKKEKSTENNNIKEKKEKKSE